MLPGLLKKSNKERKGKRACYKVMVSHTEPCDTNECQSAEMKNIFFNFHRLTFTIHGNRNFRVYITVVAQMQRRIFYSIKNGKCENITLF